MSGAQVQSQTPARTWPRDIYDVLKQVGVEQIAYVPDAGHAQLIRDCEADNAMSVVSLTTEEEGVAMLAGGWLGGKRGALLMQSSGVGNCINLLSVIQECRFPLLMIVTMRGEWGEFNPWQLPMGQSVQRVLEDSGVYVQRADRADEVRDVTYAAAQMTFSSNRPIAVLLGQRLIGFKDWSK
jgi:sulfopyruvate decarboxylase alpha subunit